MIMHFDKYRIVEQCMLTRVCLYEASQLANSKYGIGWQFRNKLRQLVLLHTLAFGVNRAFSEHIRQVPKPQVQWNLCNTATLKKTKNVFQDQLSLSAGQKYWRMLHL